MPHSIQGLSSELVLSEINLAQQRARHASLTAALQRADTQQSISSDPAVASREPDLTAASAPSSSTETDSDD